MEQCHTNEMTMMKENQAWLEAELAMMKLVVGKQFFSEATMPSGSNRTTNEQVIFFKKELEYILEICKAFISNNIVLMLFLNRLLMPLVFMKQ